MKTGITWVDIMMIIAVLLTYALVEGKNQYDKEHKIK